jgi:N-acetylmuramoyl-L-alanine amidase
MTGKRAFAALSILLWTAMVSFTPPIDPVCAETPRSTVIVIDPGHGGRNLGARGSQGAKEKELTLTLTRHLTAALETQYSVVLTRNGDFDVELRKRTAVANFHRAALLVSLHIGASFMHSPNGIAIYYHRSTNRESTEPIDGKNAPPHWDEMQSPHTAASRALAETLQRHWQEASVQVHGAPLVVLAGAVMPAIVIEIGNLANPTVEKALVSSDLLERYAKIIAEGLNLYLESTN